eukprot:GFYU01002646.1.p2 GENE.GFYU01002646.1~~GFYU01002646.1.p2  ORF type:complete len:101 (+),score=49.35 GFYU01002646.1:49-351(+)
MVKLKIEFSGGLELLFDKKKEVAVDAPADVEDSKINMKTLIEWIKTNLLKERPELFVSGDSVRPGILVLVNDTDWELLDQLEYNCEDGDNVLFISTLHGG